MMPFLHEDPDFEDLLRIVAAESGLDASLVEKDYWVTHALWSLQERGFDLWFKGGTSLSKGFGIIQRFSEDLDLRIDPGRVAGAPAVSDWKREGKSRVSERSAYFEFLRREIVIPQAEVVMVTEGADPRVRTADFNVVYPGRFLAGLVPPMRPFVRLEVGRARVEPFVERDIGSFVHEHGESRGILSRYRDNRPRRLRCVHPLVTLVDKIDAISRFHARDPFEPERFVRHYGDAAAVVAAMDRLPSAGTTPRKLVDAMTRARDIRRVPDPSDPAFTLVDDDRRSRLLSAHDAIAGMFWGERIALGDAAGILAAWIDCLRRP